MGIMGKIIGGTIGFALGGPLGAIAGAAFGHAYDATSDQQGDDRRPRLSRHDAAQATFFIAAFSMLAKIAKADGVVKKEEVESIEKFMLYELNLDPQSRHMAMNIFQAALNSRESFQDFANQFYQHFQYQPQLLELMIDMLVRVSVSDGSMTANEEKLILSAIDIFHFNQQTYHTIRSRYVRDTSKYYAVLGCQSTDSDDHIKRQYRKLVQEYHPDKILSKGLPEEFVKFANDKFREIQEAYEMIKKERGNM